MVAHKMNQKTEKTKRKTFVSLDRTASIQLSMIVVVIISYIMFLILQRYLFSFEYLLPKLIIINVLLAAGIVMEISYFIWTMYKKKKKLDAKSKANGAEMEKTKEEK
jgi:hypothetical protein